MLKRRENNTHKGNYGHLLLVCGCRTMPGAAVLATGASLQSGCGLVTLHSNYTSASAATATFPSAMISEDRGDCFSMIPRDITRFSAIGIGPGLGKEKQTIEALGELLSKAKEFNIPMLIDADALNIIAMRSEYLSIIPNGSLMTPHLGELNRLITWNDECDKDNAIFELCCKCGCTVVAKGYHSCIYTPEGEKMVNTTGNPGMAKGGSGDVLTGLAAGLMARGYNVKEAAALGTWVHGYAGDWLTEERTAEAYSSRDIIDNLWRGFKRLYQQ